MQLSFDFSTTYTPMMRLLGIAMMTLFFLMFLEAEIPELKGAYRCSWWGEKKLERRCLGVGLRFE